MAAAPTRAWLIMADSCEIYNAITQAWCQLASPQFWPEMTRPRHRLPVARRLIRMGCHPAVTVSRLVRPDRASGGGVLQSRRRLPRSHTHVPPPGSPRAHAGRRARRCRRCIAWSSAPARAGATGARAVSNRHRPRPRGRDRARPATALPWRRSSPPTSRSRLTGGHAGFSRSASSAPARRLASTRQPPARVAGPGCATCRCPPLPPRDRSRAHPGGRRPTDARRRRRGSWTAWRPGDGVALLDLRASAQGHSSFAESREPPSRNGCVRRWAPIGRHSARGTSAVTRPIRGRSRIRSAVCSRSSGQHGSGHSAFPLSLKPIIERECYQQPVTCPVEVQAQAQDIARDARERAERGAGEPRQR